MRKTILTRYGAVVLFLLGGFSLSCGKSDEVTTPESRLQKQIGDYLERAERHGFSGSVIVRRVGGDLVFAGAYGLADDSTRTLFDVETAVDIGSNSKAFVAAAVLALEEDGLLAVDDSISRYFPDVPADKQSITIHELLTHTSGLPDEYDESYAVRTRERMEREILAQPLVAAPGERFSYSDMGYALLAALVDRLSGLSYRDYVRSRLLQPAGLTGIDFPDAPEWSFNGGTFAVAHGYNNGEDSESPANEALEGWTSIGAGGLLATASAGARWHELLVGGGILNAASTGKMFSKQTVNRGSGETTIYYGYGWQLYFDPRRGNVISHSGATSSHNWYSQYLIDDSLVVVAASNRIDGEYDDRNGDGFISDDEIVSEVIYGPQVGSRLAMALHQNDFTIYPDFMVEADDDER